MPTPDFTELLNALTLQANIGPIQWAVIALTIGAVKWLKHSPLVATPKKVRPYLYLAVGVALNVGLEWFLGSLAVRTVIAQQAIVWVTTLGLRHIIDAPNAVDNDKDAGRFGDPRRP